MSTFMANKGNLFQRRCFSMQHILSLVRRCVEDYHMIEEGDTVAVGVSGGKDSVLILVSPSRFISVLSAPRRSLAHNEQGFFSFRWTNTEPVPRQRLHQARGDEGAAPSAGEAVPPPEHIIHNLPLRLCKVLILLQHQRHDILSHCVPP